MECGADRHVVAELNEVVDLRPLADPALPKGRPVDGRVRPDLDVCLDDRPPDLGNFSNPPEDGANPNPSLPITAPGWTITLSPISVRAMSTQLG
jgi:hypothetical protein